MTTAPIDVAIVEDSAVVRTTLETVIGESSHCRLVGSSRDGEQALRTIPQQKPKVVIMDLELPRVSGIECTARLKRLLPEVQVLVFTVFKDSTQIFKALSAGASGYLVKRSTPEEIVQAIRDVSNGGAPMSAEVARQVVSSFHRPDAHDADVQSLTRRESEVLALLAEGYASKQIADKLFISYDTVCGHLGRIYQKLHVRSRTEAVVKFLRDREQSGR